MELRPGAHPVTQAAHDLIGHSPGVVSNDARSVARQLLDAPFKHRRLVMADLAPAELKHVINEIYRETGSFYGLYYDSPSGFTEDVIGDTIWSLQRAVLDAVPQFKRVAVPAAFGLGKTFLAGRLVAWAGAVNPPGTITIVTTATRFRQVKFQMWPHIRKVIAKAQLPGETDLTQWKVPDAYGNEVPVAYGFTAPDNDESAMQGIHGNPKLLLVVDEAGGIAKVIGRGTNNILTGDARMLAIGNPAMDDPGSWFEELCLEGEDPNESGTTTIRIGTLDTPSFSGEVTPVCRDCSFNINQHDIASHLPDGDWLHRTLAEYGTIVDRSASNEEIIKVALEGHPYVVAKVLALFPKDAGNRVMPTSWVEGGMDMEDPEGPEYVRPCDLGLIGEHDSFTVAKGAWVRLGVDVAADGGDEFAVYRAIGDTVHFRQASSGSSNANQVVVAEKVLEEILAAQRLAAAIGSTTPVRVKIDKNGIGHGVVGMLERWGPDGTKRHNAQIVGVMVSESPEHDDESAVMRPLTKRDEMWLTGRLLLQPDPSSGRGRLRLRVDHNCKVQLSNPNLGWRGGLTKVESKTSMKARGVSSPDRAESALLAIYEPFPIRKRKRRGLLN